MDLLKEFGVEPTLLLAQIVNFLLLLFILRKFLYTPVLRMLKKRRDTIAQSLKNAEEIEHRLQQIHAEREATLRQAHEEVTRILDKATLHAEALTREMHDKAQKDVDKLLERTKATLEQERIAMYADLKAKITSLVVLTFERVAGKVLTEKDQKELIERSVKELAQ